MKIFTFSKLVLLMITFLVSQHINAQHVSILFAGDIMGHGSQIRGAENPETGEYSYDGYYTYVENIIDQADIAVANLEVTLAGAPYRGYPAFSSPDELAEETKKAGFDLLLTANNHSLDRRKKGLERTIDVLDSIGILHTGTFKNIDEKNKNRAVVIDERGVKIAFINYTYGTNGIPVTKPNVINLLDKDVIAADIAAVKKQNPDFIIACVHWGLEYQTKENSTQRDFNKFFNEQGVDIVIGSHPHVIQPMYKSDSTFVVYSLGNFVSNQRTAPRDGGAMVRLELYKDADSCVVEDASYFLTWVYAPIINGRKKFAILPVNPFIEDPSFLDKKSHDRLKSFYKEANKIYKPNIGVSEMIFNKDTPAWESAIKQ